MLYERKLRLQAPINLCPFTTDSNFVFSGTYRTTALVYATVLLNVVNRLWNTINGLFPGTKLPIARK